MSSINKSQRTFVLGLGVAKSGTTWLYNYLKSFPEADMGFKKEYHVFDAVHINGFEYFRKFREPKLEEPDKFLEKVRQQFQTLESFRQDHRKYFDYFDGLMYENLVMSGDITPSYFGLPASVLSTIKQEFEKRNILVKPVLFLRDPVDRIWSLAKMTKRRGQMGGRKFDRNEDLETIVAGLMELDHIWWMTDYKRSIESVFTAFGRDNVYVGTYERQFDRPEFLRLNQFIGLEAKTEWLGKRFNSSDRGVIEKTRSHVLTQLKVELEPQFAYCNETFPEFNLQSSWPNFAEWNPR